MRTAKSRSSTPMETSARLMCQEHKALLSTRQSNRSWKMEKNRTETFGKAIIIGPDGVRQEIELGGPLEGQLNERLPGMMRLQWEQSNKYMIGVNCRPISEALRTQLDLETERVWLLKDVVHDSPAAKAGLEQHDILMFADDTHLAANF